MQRQAALSSRAAEIAGRLLEMAEREPNEQTAAGLIERAREMLALSRDFYLTLDSVAQDNAAPRSLLADMPAELRRVLEQVGPERA